MRKLTVGVAEDLLKKSRTAALSACNIQYKDITRQSSCEDGVRKMFDRSMNRLLASKYGNP